MTVQEFEIQHRQLLLELWEVEQILGKALRYPWFVDDRKNFPEATAADGVCVGEHTVVTLAREAAARIWKLEWYLEKPEGTR